MLFSSQLLSFSSSPTLLNSNPKHRKHINMKKSGIERKKTKTSPPGGDLAVNDGGSGALRRGSAANSRRSSRRAGGVFERLQGLRDSHGSQGCDTERRRGTRSDDGGGIGRRREGLAMWRTLGSGRRSARRWRNLELSAAARRNFWSVRLPVAWACLLRLAIRAPGTGMIGHGSGSCGWLK
ncbi:uncharacterized protein M6B38_392705 [Iris pallida]|uniref:Uncharacterized protein n=1 Tax=Iris pallida TaxID=29817 RepID=A0AAX6FY85_IRIPA|nr:uncharacterized protein M6B38_392705 [Iris pallida]